MNNFNIRHYLQFFYVSWATLQLRHMSRSSGSNLNRAIFILSSVMTACSTQYIPISSSYIREMRKNGHKHYMIPLMSTIKNQLSTRIYIDKIGSCKRQCTVRSPTPTTYVYFTSSHLKHLKENLHYS